MTQFIRLKLGSHKILHSFDEQNNPVVEDVSAELAEKIVAVNRILSVSEQYILLSFTEGRYVYYEYEGSMDDLAKRLDAAELML